VRGAIRPAVCSARRASFAGYHNNLVSQWLPALGVVDKLERDAKVADVGRRTQVSIFVDDFFLVH
jgi:hypothetical protein